MSMSFSRSISIWSILKSCAINKIDRHYTRGITPKESRVAGDSSPQLSAWATQQRRNIAAMATLHLIWPAENRNHADSDDLRHYTNQPLAIIQNGRKIWWRSGFVLKLSLNFYQQQYCKQWGSWYYLRNVERPDRKRGEKILHLVSARFHTNL